MPLQRIVLRVANQCNLRSFPLSAIFGVSAFYCRFVKASLLATSVEKKAKHFNRHVKQRGKVNILKTIFERNNPTNEVQFQLDDFIQNYTNNKHGQTLSLSDLAAFIYLSDKYKVKLNLEFVAKEISRQTNTMNIIDITKSPTQIGTVMTNGNAKIIYI